MALAAIDVVGSVSRCRAGSDRTNKGFVPFAIDSYYISDSSLLTDNTVVYASMATFVYLDVNVCVPESGEVGASSGGRGLCPLCCFLHQEMCTRQTSVCFVKWAKHKQASNEQCVLHQWTPVPENLFVADHCEPGAASHKKQPSFQWG